MCIFKVESLICNIAQTPTTLIVGQVVPSLDGAGVSIRVFTMVGIAAAPHKRPQLLGFIEATYGITAVMGPLTSSAFTERVSWHWVRCLL
jgi:predicted MFS family arabinose efflux permease